MSYLNRGILLFLLFVSACDAPRTNPLDPDSPDNILTKIEGTVETVSIPRQPIAAANVLWLNRSILQRTDQNGYFLINDLEKKDGWIYFEKEGYSTDSFYVSWGTEPTYTIRAFLNAVPVIDSIIFNSVVLNRYPNRQSYSLEAKARISDSENDIDSVFLVNSELDINEVLNFNPSTGYYENSFTMEELSLTTIEQTVGKNFIIAIKDKLGNLFDIGSSNIKRIIKQEVEFDSPSNYQTVTIPFDFRWRRFSPGFQFNYDIEVYTDEVSPNLVWQRDNIHMDSISVLMTQQLLGGEYFWVIYCIDEFNNKSRSKPATFTVQQN